MAIEQFLEGKKIIVVDDEEFNRELIASILSKYGADVQQFSDSQSVIDEYIKNSTAVDLIVMDYNLKRQNPNETRFGTDAVVEIRKLVSDQRVLYSTGDHSELLVAFQGTASNDPYIQEPWEIKDFIAKVQEVINA